MLAGMGISGLAFVGVDIGGFQGAPSAELFTRWLQLGVFYPFMRVHSGFATPPREPWSYGARYELLNRQAIDLRYQLLPEIYNVIHEASETGLPVLRPLLLEFPNDSESISRQQEFLLGSDLLVVPVECEGARQQEVYLPPGIWHDFRTGKVLGAPNSGTTIQFPVTLSSIPMFVRDGAFIFRQPIVQNTGAMSGRPLQVTLYSASRSETSFYEDDGETLDYQRGFFCRRRFAADTVNAPEKRTITVDIGAPQGSYRPAPRNLLLSVWCETPPERVSLAGSPLPQVADLGQVRSGWTFDANGFVVIKVRDAFEDMRLVIEGTQPK
jgi:alpha-glucosidase